MPTYTIGAEQIPSQSHIAIENNDGTITAKHAKITVINQTELWIEDNKSTNGTFVNGMRIKAIAVKRGDIVQLAQHNITPNISKIFDNNVIIIGEAFKKHIESLTKIHMNYQQNMIKIKRDHAIKTNGIRTVISLIFAGGSYAVSKQFGVTNALGSVATILGGTIGYLISSKEIPDEKINILNKKFQQEYTCPACKASLGQTVPKFLEQNGHGCTRFRPF